MRGKRISVFSLRWCWSNKCYY